MAGGAKRERAEDEGTFKAQVTDRWGRDVDADISFGPVTRKGRRIRRLAGAAAMTLPRYGDLPQALCTHCRELIKRVPAGPHGTWVHVGADVRCAQQPVSFAGTFRLPPLAAPHAPGLAEHVLARLVSFVWPTPWCLLVRGVITPEEYVAAMRPRRRLFGG